MTDNNVGKSGQPFRVKDTWIYKNDHKITAGEVGSLVGGDIKKYPRLGKLVAGKRPEEAIADRFHGKEAVTSAIIEDAKTNGPVFLYDKEGKPIGGVGEDAKFNKNVIPSPAPAPDVESAEPSTPPAPLPEPPVSVPAAPLDKEDPKPATSDKKSDWKASSSKDIASRVAVKDEKTTVKVLRGDTLWEVAVAIKNTTLKDVKGLDVDKMAGQIATDNSISDPKKLSIGKVLTLDIEKLKACVVDKAAPAEEAAAAPVEEAAKTPAEEAEEAKKQFRISVGAKIKEAACYASYRTNWDAENTFYVSGDNIYVNTWMGTDKNILSKDEIAPFSTLKDACTHLLVHKKEIQKSLQ